MSKCKEKDSLSSLKCPECQYPRYTGDSFTLIKDISETGRCPQCGYDYVEGIWTETSRVSSECYVRDHYKKRVELFRYARSQGMERIEDLVLTDGFGILFSSVDIYDEIKEEIEKKRRRKLKLEVD